MTKATKFEEERTGESSPGLTRKLADAARTYRALADQLTGAANRLPTLSPAERGALLVELAIALRKIGDDSHEFAREAELPARRHATKGYT